MRKILSVFMLTVICMLFSIVQTQAYSEADKVPGFEDLYWGEPSESVIKKYNIGRKGIFPNNYEGYYMVLKENQLFGVNVYPQADMSFIDNKLYSITATYTTYGNMTDYNAAKTKLTALFGVPEINTSAGMEYTTWRNDTYFVTLMPYCISIGNIALGVNLEKKLSEDKGEHISDWNSYINGKK